MNNKEICINIATKIMGDKWTPKIILSLLDKPKHFCEIQETVEGINPRILSLRLHKLASAKIINKVKLEENDARDVYELTHIGKELLPILKDMAIWGEKYKKLLSQQNPTQL